MEEILNELKAIFPGFNIYLLLISITVFIMGMYLFLRKEDGG